VFSKDRRWGRTRPVTLSLSVLGAVALGVTACTVPGGGGGAAPGPAPAPGSCAPVEVIAARGTGELQSGSIIMGGLSNGIAQQTGGRVYHVVYPASVDYLNGPGQGAADALAHIRATAAACPSTKFVLNGYSEGAMVVVTLMGQLPADLGAKVAAAVLYGNPYFKANTAASAGTAKSTGTGLVPIMGIPAGYVARSIDFCDTGDPICGAGANIMAHLGYGAHQAEGIAFAVAKVRG
jgi:cutinase